MIDEKYYKGFEGEGAYILYYVTKAGEQEGLYIWEGFLYALLAGCFYPDYFSDGLVGTWNISMDFPQKINNIALAIKELKEFSIDKMKENYPSMIEDMPMLQKDILELLEKAQLEGLDVYIDED